MPALVARLLESAAVTRSLLPDVLLAAAVPRDFDLPVVARLLGTSTDDEELVAAFDALVDYPIVERRRSAWSLHEVVRSALLDHWTATPERTARFQEHLGTLTAYYLERYDRARRAATGLGQVEHLLAQGNPTRARSLREAAEDQRIRAAAEAVHTDLRIGATEGWTRMVHLYNELEGDFEFRLCDLLTRAWVADEHLVPPEGRALHGAWGTYFHARAARMRRDSVTALALLDGIPDPESIDLKYATWHHSERGRTLRALCRFDEALEAVDREVAIHQAHGVDPRNSATPLADRAALFALLWDSEPEIASIREATDLADRCGPPAQQVSSHLALAASLRAGGFEVEAARELLGAVWAARGALGDTPADSIRWVSGNAVETAISLFGSTSSRLLATLVEQQDQLTVGGGIDARLDRLLLHARAYTDGGDARRGQEIYDEARLLAEEKLPGRMSEVEAQEAGQAAALGKAEWGADTNLALLNRPGTGDDPWRMAQVLTNAGADLLAAGQYARSLECVDRAASLWEAMGHRRATGYVRALRGELRRRSGDLTGAAEELAASDAGPSRGFERDRLESLARLARDLGRYDEAAGHALAAAAVASGVGNVIEAVESRAFAVDCLVRAHRFADAVTALGRCDDEVSALRAFNEWQPSAGSVQADQQAGRAVWVLVRGVGPLAARVRSALEHLDEAIATDGTVWWYWLEAAMAESAVDHRTEAADRLGRAIMAADPGPLRTAMEALAGGLAQGTVPRVAPR